MVLGINDERAYNGTSASLLSGSFEKDINRTQTKSFMSCAPLDMFYCLRIAPSEGLRIGPSPSLYSTLAIAIPSPFLAFFSVPASAYLKKPLSVMVFSMEPYSATFSMNVASPTVLAAASILCDATASEM